MSAYECCYISGRCDHPECGAYPDSVQQQPEPTPEEYCEPHDYYGDDVMQQEAEGGGVEEVPVGRCWCGKKLYPAGGFAVSGVTPERPT